MIARTHRLPVVRQCRLVELSRSTAYYRPREESEENLAVMKEIDRLYMERPTSGSRTIKSMLKARGFRIARSRVVRLMRLRAIYPKCRTSSPGEGHKIYPYLLRSMKVTRPREVYARDITYIPMAKGFLYLVAVIDWHSRKVLAHRLSNTLDASFCVEAMKEAIACYGAPEVFNTDQGAQFTSEAFTDALKAHGVRISMDGKGRWLDNVYVERLWRSLKQEEVYRGVYHKMSVKHLDRYVNEFTGRHNVRPLDTLEQMQRVFQGMEGKRLRYIDLTSLKLYITAQSKTNPI